MERSEWLTLICAFGSGLVGGVFYGFSSFVMGALAAIEPSAGIAAMQSINIVVKNMWFPLFLFGVVLPCLWLGWLSWGDRSREARLTLAGAVLYVAGTIGVTFVFNVPQNDALGVLDAGSSAAAALWLDYVPSWTFWNHVRCATCCLASLLFTLAFARQRAAHEVAAV